VPAARATVRLYLLGTAAGAGLWALSTVVPGPARYLLWGVAVLVEAAVPLRATAGDDQVPLHLEHLPERFALFVILVLGESVAAVAHGVHDAHWSGDAVGVGAAAFVLAAALWWTWFDLAGAAAKRLLVRSGGHRSAREHDVFVFGQLPLCLALAAVGAGIQLAVLEAAAGQVPAPTRLLLAGGVALYLAAVGVTNAAMAGTWRSVWLWPAAAAVLAGVDAAVPLPAVVIVAALAGLLVALLVVGVAGHLEVDPV
jgi:low temperature requirement protein LtrA